MPLLNLDKTWKKGFSPFFFFLITATSLWGQEQDSIADNFELSFGQSTLFISNDQAAAIKNDFNVVIPTNSMLFFSEFRPFKTIKIPVVFNLPTESKQFVIDGKLVSEKASPTLASGVEFKLFDFKIPYNAQVEMDLGTLGSVIFRSNYKLAFAPLITNRIRIIKDKNFIMYLGGSYSVGVNTWGMFYGTGYIF
ncbi:MAG: hypothetical protein N4A35_14725 [Flavobacteriales bacterium]|jgi:hypothetical protein|nr:hypothetical protein [Flavobacteriales bacterium]